jgi:hypothetical protein
VTNAEGLKERACECYDVVKSELQRLRRLPGDRPRGFDAAATT